MQYMCPNNYKKDPREDPKQNVLSLSNSSHWGPRVYL